jgi:acyl carrier protein phosphodiesterase
MNFLLHFHLAARDLGRPGAAAGAMLPDLWRMADRRVRPSPVSSPHAGAPLRDVLDGIAHHLEADRRFHAAPVFREGERATADAFRAAAVRAPRITLFAHVAWELCLDGALLLGTGLDTMQAALSGGLAAMAEAGAAAEAATLHHFAPRARSEADRDAFDRRMARIAMELARGSWIAGYRTGAGIAARIEGVRAGLGLPAFDADDRARAASALDHGLVLARAALADVLSRG